jgi:transposase
VARRRKEKRRPLPRRPGWRDVSDAFWATVEPLLPPPPRRGSKGGRPPLEPRRVLNGILYVLRTGCQWKMLPREYGSGSTCHRYFQAWVRARVFRQLWRRCLQEYDELQGVDWRWQSIDSAIVPAPVKRGPPSARTRRIAARTGRSATSGWIGRGSRWGSSSRRPIGMT